MKNFWRFFLITCLPLLVVVLLTVKVAFVTADGAREREREEVLKSVWTLADLLIEDEETAVNLFEKKEETTTRQIYLSLIDPAGKVIVDTSGELPSLMKDHDYADFEELFQVKGGERESFSVRLNTALKTMVLSYAARRADGSILRVSLPEGEGDIIPGWWFLILMAGIILTTAVSSAYAASRVNIAVRRLHEITDRLAAGKRHVHFPDFRDPTMKSISSLLRRTHRLMREEQVRLERRNRLFQKVLASLDTGIVSVDGSGRVTYVNKRGKEIIGDEIDVGRPLMENLSDPDAILLFKDLGSEGTVRLVRRVRGMVLEAVKGEAEGETIYLLQDITRKERFDEFKEELIGNISHELRTPLSLIMGYAETLATTPSLDEETRRDFIDSIYWGTKRLSALIDDMLELHRLESMDTSFSVEEPANLEEAVAELEQTLSEREGKNLSVRHPGGEVRIHYDHLLSVLVNLCDNAMKYSTGENVYVEIKRSGRQVTVTVDDEGPVIPEEKREMIFRRFYTVSSSRNRKRSGTGLGLSIVKHICTLYGGNVTVSPNDLGGNRFTAVLYEKEESTS